MTVQELYEWAKEKDLLDTQIAKHFNFQIEDIESVGYYTKEFIKVGDRIILD